MFFVEDIKWETLRKGFCSKSHSQEVADYRFQFWPGALEPAPVHHIPAASGQGSLCQSPNVLIIDEARFPSPRLLPPGLRFLIRWASPQNLLEGHRED